MDLQEAFGLVVRRERKRLGLTQEQLAELADLHTNYIGLVERGRTSAALDTISSLAQALERRPSQLLRAAEREVLAGR